MVGVKMSIRINKRESPMIWRRPISAIRTSQLNWKILKPKTAIITDFNGCYCVRLIIGLIKNFANFRIFKNVAVFLPLNIVLYFSSKAFNSALEYYSIRKS